MNQITLHKENKRAMKAFKSMKPRPRVYKKGVHTSAGVCTVAQSSVPMLRAFVMFILSRVPGTLIGHDTYAQGTINQGLQDEHKILSIRS